MFGSGPSYLFTYISAQVRRDNQDQMCDKIRDKTLLLIPNLIFLENSANSGLTNLSSSCFTLSARFDTITKTPKGFNFLIKDISINESKIKKFRN